MRTAFRKIRRDLWDSKGRTLLVVLSIAAGVMAVGMITASNSTLTRQIGQAHRGSHPSHAWLYLNGVVDQSTVNSLSRTDGVQQIEGLTEASIRWKPSLDAEWDDATLYTLPDFGQGLDRLTLQSGMWPFEQSVSVEASHVDPYGIPGVGETLFFEVNGRARPVRIGGTLRDPFQFPPPFGASTAFYVTPAMLDRLTGFQGFNILRFTAQEYSPEEVQRLADEIDRKLQRQGMAVGFVQELSPDRHFVQDIVDGVGLVLTVMAAASLGLSTFLVVNTMNALVAHQVPQIGIMKAVGGVRRQIATLYLAGVIVYGLLSLLVSIPLGALGGDAMSRWILTLLNVPTARFEVLPVSLSIQVLTGLLTPLLAALYPVLEGVRISVARALSTYGLGSGRYGTGRVDRLLGGLQGLPRLAALALRNTFRRPGRVALTMITLTTAGAIFMLVLTTHHSFNFTIEKIFRGFGFDVLIGFEQPQRMDEILPQIEARPNVTRAEMWAFLRGEARLDGDRDSAQDHEIFMRGIPRDSQLFTPELVAGRLLLPQDGHAMLLNQKLARRMGVGVGDRITVSLPRGESTWTVVGLLFDLSGRDQDTAYVYLDVLNEDINLVGRGSVAEVKGTEESLRLQQEIARDLRQYFEGQGVGISFTDTALENREQSNAQINILTTILLVMTLLMAFVGSIGLSGTLSINVIERRREIGVMRAVGASSWDVYRVYTTEGLLLGVISWAQAIPVSLIFGPLFVQAIGEVIEFPAVYDVYFAGMGIWLVVVLVLSLVASWLPARRATQISVNESLAYE